MTNLWAGKWGKQARLANLMENYVFPGFKLEKRKRSPNGT